MMMLRLTNNTGGTITIANTGVENGSFKLFPADRCTWTTQYNATTRNYEITIAEFYPGNGNAASLNGTNRVVELGYIGKSGRFVEITD